MEKSGQEEEEKKKKTLTSGESGQEVGEKIKDMRRGDNLAKKKKKR